MGNKMTTNKKLLKNSPLIHGDIMNKPEFSYPTHTHGFDKYGWPELFVSAITFGFEGNITVIQNVFVYFWSNQDKMETLKKEKYIEIEKLWSNSDLIICLRILDYKFLGLRKAYTPHQLSKIGHAQIFVKGYYYELTDSYYENIPDNESNFEHINLISNNIKWN